MKNILVAVDFSPVTDSVTDVVTNIAMKCGAKVYLVHVAPAFIADVKTVKVPQHERDFLAHMLRAEHRDLQVLADKLTDRGCDAEALMVEGDGTVEKILDEAHALDAEMIVVGSHRHGRIYEMMVGSSADGILRNSRLPVLVVPEAGE